MIELWEVIPLVPLLSISRRNEFVIEIGPVDIKPLYGKLINAHRVLLADLKQLDVVIVTGVLI